MNDNYFEVAEFFEHCSSKEIYEVINNREKSSSLLRLWQLMNRLRYWLQFPILINSGYRGREHNKRVGGVFNSQHCYMQAVDVTCGSVYILDLLWTILTTRVDLFHEVGQIIYYKKRRFIHIALPNEKHPCRTIINQ